MNPSLVHLGAPSVGVILVLAPACGDPAPRDTSQTFGDVGACGIAFNDVPVHDIVNPYFEGLHDYDPWHDTFMRTVVGHDDHFHVRVEKLDGTCN